MPKCPKCKTESPKQFVSVKTVKEEYQQCKTCGFKLIPFEVTIKVAPLNLLKEKTIQVDISKEIEEMNLIMKNPQVLKQPKMKTKKIIVKILAIFLKGFDRIIGFFSICGISILGCGTSGIGGDI